MFNESEGIRRNDKLKKIAQERKNAEDHEFKNNLDF